MSEVLDQNEIDSLLSALSASQDEIGEGALESGSAPRVRPSVQVYDFRRPERVTKDQIRALLSIHEVFARNLGATLSGFLRTLIDVRVVGVEQLTYNEFIQSLPNPTCFMILEAPPLEGQMCLELSPLIVFPIIDRLLGGSSTNLFIPQRPLTSIEWRLITRIIDRALEHLSEVWRNLVDAQFNCSETESNPQLVHIVAPSEIVVFVTFEIKLGQSAGTMSLCIPFNTIESVLSHLTTQSWFYKPKPATENHLRRLTRNLVKSAVQARVYLGRSRIRLSELRNLQIGDVLPLEKRSSHPLIMQVEGRNKFAGSPGQCRGYRALRIQRTAEPDELL